MSPETEKLLYCILWFADMALRPSWRNLERSFEAWAWQNHLGRRLTQLEQLRLIERHPDPDLDRVVRLTEAGRMAVLGGRDPTTRWNRNWDGSWRLILFDLPQSQSKLRLRFWRALRRLHFGFLQGSVWVSPDSAEQLRNLLVQQRVDAEAFLVVEGKPAAGETDQDIVAGAWDFALIDRRYKAYLEFIQQAPVTATRLPGWVEQERTLWQNALEPDPLLPRALCPAGYLGMRALKQREAAYARLAAIRRAHFAKTV